jgi:hypothetical protein
VWSRLSLVVDASRYTLHKNSTSWSVSRWAPHAEYRFPASPSGSPLVGLRAGFAYLSVEGKRWEDSTFGIVTTEENESGAGGYVGVSVLMPIEDSAFGVLFIIDKTFADITILDIRESFGSFDVAVGVTLLIFDSNRH